jgi:ParB-like chromosome segregation protein Spo0J
MKIKCTMDKEVPIEELVPNPRNPNKHGEDQVKLLAKIIDFQGWRSPVVVSTLSGYVVRGHGRLLAARHLGLDHVPVDFQDYENEAQEHADLVADNRIAELAEMDQAGLKDLIESLDTGEIDLELTGFDKLSLAALMSQVFVGDDEDEGDQGVEDVPTIEEVRDAVKILSAQCGNARIRNPNKKTILAFLDHHHPTD